MGVGAASGGLTLSQEITQAALDSRARQGGRRQQVGIEPKGRSLTASLSVLSPPASNLPPDRQDARQPRSRNPSSWSVEDVVWFLKDADPQALGPHVELFRKHVCTVGALGVGSRSCGVGSVCTTPWGCHSREARGDHRFLRAEQPLSLTLKARLSHLCPHLAFVRSPVFSAIYLCIQQTLVTHLQRASKLTVPILKLL